MKKALEGLAKWFSFLTNNKFFWYVVLASLSYYGFRRLTTSPEVTFLNQSIPNSGKDIPQNWTPDDLVERFHQYFSSWFDVIINTSDLEISYRLANALSDGQFFVTAQTYNAKWAKKDGIGIFRDTSETLWKRVNSSKKILFGTGSGEQTKFYERMIRLKLNY